MVFDVEMRRIDPVVKNLFIRNGLDLSLKMRWLKNNHCFCWGHCYAGFMQARGDTYGRWR